MPFEQPELIPELMLPKEKRFVAENFNALLMVEKPETIEERAVGAAREFSLKLKEEFHLSVISFRNGLILKNIAAEPDREELKEFISTRFEKLEWQYRLLPEYFFMQKFYSKEELTEAGLGPDVPEHTRSSIVQKAVLTELTEFYAEINEKAGLNLPVPSPHLTLYTGSDHEPFASAGIGIYSEKEFKEHLQKPLQ